jgi:hypothetical protein
MKKFDLNKLLKLVFRVQEHVLIGLRKEGSVPVQDHVLKPDDRQ